MSSFIHKIRIVGHQNGGRGHLLTLRVSFTLNVVCIKGPTVKIEMNDLRAKGAVIFSLSLYLSLLIRLCGLKKTRIYTWHISLWLQSSNWQFFGSTRRVSLLCLRAYTKMSIQNVIFFLFKRDTFLLDVPFSENGEAYIEQLTTWKKKPHTHNNMKQI